MNNSINCEVPKIVQPAPVPVQAPVPVSVESLSEQEIQAMKPEALEAAAKTLQLPAPFLARALVAAFRKSAAHFADPEAFALAKAALSYYVSYVGDRDRAIRDLTTYVIDRCSHEDTMAIFRFCATALKGVKNEVVLTAYKVAHMVTGTEPTSIIPVSSEKILALASSDDLPTMEEIQNMGFEAIQKATDGVSHPCQFLAKAFVATYKKIVATKAEDEGEYNKAHLNATTITNLYLDRVSHDLQNEAATLLKSEVFENRYLDALNDQEMKDFPGWVDNFFKNTITVREFGLISQT